MEPAVAALREQAQQGNDGALYRLGCSLLRELEWRASWGSGAAPSLCTLPQSLAVRVPGQASAPLSELPLPPLQSRDGLELAHAAHAHCCAGAAGRGQWAEAEEHAASAGGCLDRLSSEHGTRGGSSWSAFCHAHNTLLCALEGGGGTGRWRELGRALGGQKPYSWSAGAAPRRNLEIGGLEVWSRLREECAALRDPVRRSEGSRGVGPAALLRSAYGAVLMCWRLCGASHAVELMVCVLQTAAWLQREEGAPAARGRGGSPPAKRQRGDKGARDSGAAAGERGAMGGVVLKRLVPLMRELLRLSPASVARVGRGASVPLGESQLGLVQYDGPVTEFADAQEEGDAARETGLPHLLQLVPLATLLLADGGAAPGTGRVAGSGGETERGAIDQRSLLHELLDELSDSPPPALLGGGHGSCNEDAAQSLLALGGAQYARALELWCDALGGFALAGGATTGAPSAESLDAARRSSAACVVSLQRALCRRERRVWAPAEGTLAEAATRLHALLLFLCGEGVAATQAIEEYCATQLASAQAHSLCAVLLAQSGRPEAAVRALHHALALQRSGGDGGGDAVQLLHNIVVVQDELRQEETALHMSEFLTAAAEETTDVTDGLTPQATVPAHQPRLLALRLRLTGGAHGAAGWAPELRLGACASVPRSCAAYVHARAKLLAGRWAEAADALRKLALGGPGLRAALGALGVSHVDLLRQAALALLRDGRYAEVVELVAESGSGDVAEMRMMHADALLCMERPGEALRLLPETVPAHGASAAVRAKTKTPAGVGGAAALAEARWRNNRACLLVCELRLDEAEAELRCCVQLAPADAEFEFNLSLVLWKLGERRAACERWLTARGYPTDASAAAYARLVDGVRPSAAEAEAARATAHASGALDAGQLAGLDRLALRYFEELRRTEEFPAYWEASGDGGGGY